MRSVDPRAIAIATDMLKTLTCVTGPAPIPTLDAFMEIQDTALKAFIARLRGEEDIYPMFLFVDPRGRHWSMMPTYEDKDIEWLTFKAAAFERGAVLYAVITSAWRSGSLTPEQFETYQREGWTPELLKHRIEVAEVVAGDRERTLMRDYKMIRANGIVRLEEIPALPEEQRIGRMFDMLVPRTAKH